MWLKFGEMKELVENVGLEDIFVENVGLEDIFYQTFIIISKTKVLSICKIIPCIAEQS